MTSPTQTTVQSNQPEIYVANVGNSPKEFIRHIVYGDGHCGYTAFGIDREEAATLLQNDIKSISKIIQLLVEQALLTAEFYTYLCDKKIVIDSTHPEITDGALLKQFAAKLDIQKAYINYDVRDKKIDSGYTHPKILQALAHIRGIDLYIWTLGENNSLVPHRVGDEDYSVYCSPKADERIDLLFDMGNHFDRLEECTSYRTDNRTQRDPALPKAEPTASSTPATSSPPVVSTTSVIATVDSTGPETWMKKLQQLKQHNQNKYNKTVEEIIQSQKAEEDRISPANPKENLGIRQNSSENPSNKQSNESSQIEHDRELALAIAAEELENARRRSFRQ